MYKFLIAVILLLSLLSGCTKESIKANEGKPKKDTIEQNTLPTPNTNTTVNHNNRETEEQSKLRKMQQMLNFQK